MVSSVLTSDIAYIACEGSFLTPEDFCLDERVRLGDTLELAVYDSDECLSFYEFYTVESIEPSADAVGEYEVTTFYSGNSL